MGATVHQLPEDKRDNKRQRLLLTARMLNRHGEHEVHLLNLSHNGAKLDTDTPPSRDEHITLIYADLTISARVAWVEGNRFGIAFDQPIDETRILPRGQHHVAG